MEAIFGAVSMFAAVYLWRAS
ncbi:PGF-CTERM sorting domain-containing protein [Burkholderia pseudomallei]|nr:hypothetical protein [Burkholderia pseudomallei]MBM5633308.1 hypothetical protein [Burkholderia pseudomallei]MBM5661852.1 hypothetical protein [Burkholderia pseudomallei]